MHPHSPLRALGLMFAFAATVLAAGAPPARAGEAYYLLMFGAQRTPPDPNHAHSFATFVHACWEGDGPCPAHAAIESHTISWLAATGVVHTLALHPECGRNFGLHETIRWCQKNDMRISVWGAYCIEPVLYGRALRQIALLESGKVRYKANDMGYRSDEVSNCIHAVSVLSEGYRLRVASPGWGETASYFILQELEPWIIDPDTTYPWVAYALGLDQYPLIYRDYENPRSGAIRGPGRRLLGGERNLQATYGPPR